MTRIAPLLLLLALAPGGAPARPPTAPDAFLLGRDGGGEPCAAARNWHDPRRVTPFDSAWSITCRGVSASRPVGWVVAVRHAPASPIDPKQCGAAQPRQLAGIGAVTVRSCADDGLGTAAVTVSFDRRGTLYVGAAQPATLGPLEAALRIAAGSGETVGRDATVKPSLAVAGLPAAPALKAAARNTDFDVAATLQTGIALNHRGFYVEASRLLNDALSRVDDGTPPLIHAELELEAALADSNISQLDAADDHFARAEALFAANRGSDRAAFLQAKLATYRGMDRLNRREWQAAVTALADTSGQNNPLEDAATLSRLNQPAQPGTRSVGVASIDGAQLSRLLLEAQRNWALSVAYLALDRDAESRRAIAQAGQAVTELSRSVDPLTVAPLKSRVERQAGRIEAHAGRVEPALAQFDCAIATLQGAVGNNCPFTTATAARGRPAAAGAGTIVDGPMLAETELERASVLGRRKDVPSETLLAAYRAGIDALIASGATGSGVPSALEDYLNLLARLQGKQPSPAYVEAFFRAVQAIGEPAIARQVAQLQNIVTAGGAIGAKVRDREELERQVVRLRYAIAAGANPDGPSPAALEGERAAAETKLAALNAEIAADPHYRAVDDQPATAAELQAALRPGEAYLKVLSLRSTAYGIVLTRDQAFVYALGAPARTVTAIAQRVRASIRDDSGKLPFFDVPASYTLFRLVAGPADAALLAARSVVIDPSGPLENLPAAVLVTSEASMKAYMAQRADAPNDYSRVAFLAKQAEVSNALSPRSFLIARKLPESGADRPFLGLGENAAPTQLPPAEMARTVSFGGGGCDISYRELAAIMSANRPVSAAEIGIAARALGVPNAPEITGEAFTDTKVEADSARGDFLHYQVLHFATHGLPETRFRCTVVPPALVTTLAPPTAAGSPQSDGLLSFADIARLRLDANLVVLSACETAAGISAVGGRLGGQDESAKSLDGLVRAFITANARAVLATYWKVPANAKTDELIAAFYASGRNETIGAALRDAQATLIRQPPVSHPYFWGAYFLVGDASKTMLSPPRRAVTASR